jgi:choice-of-anchor B domain-containing protein
MNTLISTINSFTMKIYLLLFSLLLSGVIVAQESLNLELFGQYNPGDGRASGSWSYITDDGQEYALLGAQTGTSIINISDADQIEEVAFIPGPPSNWREITVVNKHAYVTTEGSSPNHPGMQIISLENLPSATLTATYNNTFNQGHIIQKDIFSPSPYVYVCGTSSTQGIHILDVSNPGSPEQVGLYFPGYYIHDCHVRGDLLFAAAFYEGTIDIVDISDKTNPTLISRIPDPGANTHSFSTTEDLNYLIIADELDGLPGRIFDISDLSDPTEVARYTANSASLVHNPYMIGDFCFITHNSEGLRVLDMTDPTVPIEVGYYDTYPGPSGGFNGLWSACPYYPSGKIIGGNREDGLYVWTFNNTKGGRFYGQIVDQETGAPIFNASVVFSATAELVKSDAGGNFKVGSLPGEYTLEVSASGYQAVTLDIVVEAEAQDSMLIELSPLTSNIEDETTTPWVELSPNPFKDQLHVSLNNITTGASIMLIDVKGQIVKKMPMNGQQQLDINTSTLPAGSYYLKVTSREGAPIVQQRVIKY